MLMKNIHFLGYFNNCVKELVNTKKISKNFINTKIICVKCAEYD